MSGKVVGRDREIGVAEAFLGRMTRGPSALLFAGEPGIGKTTVWQETVERARAAGHMVLSARPAEAEAGLAFAALADLLEPVIDTELSAMAAPQRHALAVALLREDPGRDRLDQRAVAAAVLSVLRSLASLSPVLVAVDDLQWLDRPTARVLEFGARRLAELPVGVLASERIEDGVSVPLNLERALGGDRSMRVQLGPLSAAALDRVLAEQLGRSIPRRLLARLHEAVGGNPFFALEVARLVPPGASGFEAFPMPGNLHRLVENRVAGVPERGREALLAAAAMRAPTLELVAATAPGRRGDVLRALQDAATAGVISIDGPEIRFAHPLFAAAVYSLAPPAQRRLAHRRLAHLVPGIEERARHVALGAEAASERLAVAVDEAAEHARRRGAPEAAAELAEGALALTPASNAEGLQRRSIRVAEYQFHSGELRGPREMLEAVLRQATAEPVRADALRLLGEIRFHEDSYTEAIRLFEDALKHAHGDLALQAVLGLRLAFTTVSTGDFESANAHARRALSLAERAGDPGLLAESLAVASIADFLIGHGLRQARIERALQLEDPDRNVPVQLRPSLIAGYLALYAGHLDKCKLILGALRERIIERGQESDLGFVLCYLIWASCWTGDLQEATRYASELIDSAARLDSDAARCQALAFAALASAYTGEVTLTRRRASECLALAERTGYRIIGQWAGWALALLALSLGEPQAADAALGSLVTMAEGGVTDPIRAFWLPDQIEALIALGQLESAERLLTMFEAAAKRLERGWAMMLSSRCRALLLAAYGDLVAASHAAAEAIELARRLELRIEAARTFLVAGRIQRRLRMKGTAAAHLRQALQTFEAAGAAAWSERTRAELRRVGLRPPAPAGLTVSEQRVAELAASGLTNRQVAAQLFISPKTVEANLARAYRKLGIHSRAELGAQIARVWQDGPPGSRATPRSRRTTSPADTTQGPHPG